MVLVANPTKTRRAKAGEKVAVAQNAEGRRLFVLATNTDTKVHMPKGTKLLFDAHIECSGGRIHGIRAPSGWLKYKTVRIEYRRDPVLRRRPLRPLIRTRSEGVFLGYVYSGQTAKVVEVPDS